MKLSLYVAPSVLALTLSSFAAGSAYADASTSLPACYDHVITACNQTAHPVSCSESGMDACDEEHSASDVGIDLRGIRILVGPDRGEETVYRIVLETDRPQSRRPGTHDGDDGSRPEPSDDPNGGGTGQQPQQGN
ncbi:MAG: hypothetical protein RIB61_06280 [Roseicyclus sp.]|jgi:hypothetical protein